MKIMFVKYKKIMKNIDILAFQFHISVKILRYLTILIRIRIDMKARKMQLCDIPFTTQSKRVK